MSKLRAFLTHLGLSATVVGIVILLVLLVWYPSPYFDAVGTREVLRVFVGVDLVVGPLLTLIVFRPNKPGLLLDMSVILTVQLMALAYGVSVLYQERPYYLVFAVDRFHILASKDVAGEEAVEWLDKPWVGPARVVANRPADPLGRNRLLEETLFAGAPDIERRPEFWARYTEETRQIIGRATPIAALRQGGEAVAREIDTLLATQGVTADQLAFLPISSAKSDMAAVIDTDSAEIVAVIDVDPWPLLLRNKG